MSELDTD